MTFKEHIKKSVAKVKTWPKWKKDIFGMADEYCPHCGYYCTGKTIFCTKHIDRQLKNNYGE